MNYHIEFVENVPDVDALEALLRQYYSGILPKFEALSGISVDPADMARDSIAHLPDMLPPDGRLALAHTDEGRLVGCGTLRRIRPAAAEMKRMFVHPDVRGSGMGRALFERRLREAQAMGCTHVYADTVKGNEAMLTMYRNFGFRAVDRYPENANPPEYAPHLEFLEYRFEDDAQT